MWLVPPRPHGSRLWYACEQAERPPDPFVLWHYDDCKPCSWKAAFTIQQGGPGVHILARLMGIH